MRDLLTCDYSGGCDGHSASAHSRDVPGLDGLRAIAVLMVVLYHSADDFTPGNLLRPIAEIGSFGVAIFFVLSGFLITHLLLREEERYRGVDLGKFYVRRAIRILPPAFFLVAVFVALKWLGWLDETPAVLASCLLFYRNYIEGHRATGHLWTLAVEEHFYLIWPIVFVACRNPRLRLWVVGLAVAYAPFWRRIAIWQAGSADAVNWFRTDLRYDGILVGCLLALMTRVGAAERWLGSRPMRHGAASCLALAALAGTFTPAIAALRLIDSIAPTVQYLCVAIVLNQVTRSPEGLLTRFLSLAAIAWIGRLSYSIYLWQQLFSASTWPGLASRACHLPWNLAAIASTSIFSYYFVERPFFRLRARFRRQIEPGRNPEPARADGLGLLLPNAASERTTISTRSRSF